MYICNWNSKWQVDEENTTINHYIVNYHTMLTQTIGTKRVRRIDLSMSLPRVPIR